MMPEAVTAFYGFFVLDQFAVLAKVLICLGSAFGHGVVNQLHER